LTLPFIEGSMLMLFPLQEIAANLHIPSLRFAMESKSMRGKKAYDKLLAGASPVCLGIFYAFRLTCCLYVLQSLVGF